MAEPDLDTRELRARQGDREALASLFDEHAQRLRRWVDLRLGPRLRGRVDASDILQEVYLAAEQRLDHFRSRPELTFAVWARLLAGQRLIDARRRHFGAEARDANREVPLDAHPLHTSSANLAGQLADDLTSPSQAVAHRELHQALAQVIDSMDELDREVLTLRHFDDLTNDEVAQLLGVSKSTASKRYVRALGRLRVALERFPELLERPSDQ